MKTVPVAELSQYVGQVLGQSEWLVIDQARINAFADCTLDHQFIHVNPEAAKLTPFGTTIAHGFLTLSLTPHLQSSVKGNIAPQGTKMALNYGLDKVRFLQPVKVNSSVRLQLKLLDISEKKSGQYLFKYESTLEIEGESRPALIAESLALFFT